jgi:hypothetical protein
MALINPARDYETLALAADELFEETLTAKDQERQLRNAERAANRDRMVEKSGPQRKFAAGYYAWIGYLFGLEETIDSGVQFNIHDLLATEVTGLKIVASARARFHAKYPPCPRCGQNNQKFAPKCSSCGAEFKKPETGNKLRRSA